MALIFTSDLPTSTINLTEGDVLNLSVALSSDDVNHDSYTYQWSKDGAPLVGETADTLTNPSVVVSDLGLYAVDVESLDSLSNVIETTQTSVQVNVTALPAPGPSVTLINGRTPEEHRRMVLLGII